MKNLSLLFLISSLSFTSLTYSRSIRDYNSSRIERSVKRNTEEVIDRFRDEFNLIKDEFDLMTAKRIKDKIKSNPENFEVNREKNAYEWVINLAKKGLTLKQIELIIIQNIETNKYLQAGPEKRNTLLRERIDHQKKRVKELYLNVRRINERVNNSSDEFKSLYQEIKRSRDKNNEQIHSSLLKSLHKNIYIYALITNKLNTTLREGFFILDEMDNKNKVQVSTKTSENKIQHSTYSDKRFKTLFLSLRTREGRMLLRDIKISLAASLSQLDYYEYALGPFLEDSVLRDSLFLDVPAHVRKINAAQIVKSVYENYQSFLNSKKTKNAIELYKKAQILIQNCAEHCDILNEDEKEMEQKVDNIIANSFIFKYLTGEDKDSKKHFNTPSVIRDDLKKNFNDMTYGLSKVFGNTAGSDTFVSRRGKLFDLKSRDPKTFKRLVKEMRALDIILEKTPFRATDAFIPGHWGHVAIWLGTKEELKEHGLWAQDDTDLTDGRLDRLDSIYKNQALIKVEDDDDYIINIREVLDKLIKTDKDLEELAKDDPTYTKYNWFKIMILNGHHIVEALRPGVQLNTMEHFLEIDDLAIIRPNYCEQRNNGGKCFTKEERSRFLQNAFYQIGKNYDFNFDANTEDRIVCSELAYITFDKKELIWQTTREVLGMQSISPDQVAYRADEDNDYFYPVKIFFNGTEIEHKSIYLTTDIFNAITHTNYDQVELMTGISANYKIYGIRKELFDSEDEYEAWVNDNN